MYIQHSSPPAHTDHAVHTTLYPLDYNILNHFYCFFTCFFSLFILSSLLLSLFSYICCNILKAPKLMTQWQ